VATILAACATAPAGRDALALLAHGESLLAQGNFTGAVELLEEVAEDSFAGEDQERYKLALARAYYGSSEPWEAFTVIRDYLERHPLTVYASQIDQLTFDVGRTLIASDWRFLIFASDRDDGILVLEHFVRRFPKSPRAPDAYHLLGEAAFNAKRYARAQEYYRQITTSYGDSVWTTKAKYRYAMASFALVQGPEYDLGQLERTRSELQSFLDDQPENIDYRRDAEQALATTTEWLAQKHLSIADYYRVLGNEPGQRHHLAIAAGRFSATTAGREAQARLATLTTGSGP
jgi:outer membrane protein assembly factor BamD (BamD/ComL family)